MEQKSAEQIKEEVAEDIAKRNKRVKLVATDGNPHMAEGHTFEIHPVHEDKLIKNKWAVKPGEDTKTKGKATKPAGAIPTTEANTNA